MNKDNDPTKIDIEFDPTVQRMKGIAIHGMTPFDVPFISNIEKNLWQGGCKDGLIAPNSIDVIISLYPWEKYKLLNHQILVSYRMYDSTDQGFDQIEEIAQQVNIYLDYGKTVLVHCQAGLNRSSLVVARSLMLKGRTAKDSITLLREKRSMACLCNPSFEKYLLSL